MMHLPWIGEVDKTGVIAVSTGSNALIFYIKTVWISLNALGVIAVKEWWFIEICQISTLP